MTTRSPLTDPRPGDVVRIPGGEWRVYGLDREFGSGEETVLFRVHTRAGRFLGLGADWTIEEWREQCRMLRAKVVA